MSSWIQKASSLIDTIDQVANKNITKEDETQQKNDDITDEYGMIQHDDETESTKDASHETERNNTNPPTHAPHQKEEHKPIHNTDKTEPKHNNDHPPDIDSTPKPKKQSKSKSKSKSKQNKTSINSDYVSLKKQYEGMVKLWNEERANLKKAQQLLRNQKESFKSQQQTLHDHHISEMNELMDKHKQDIAAKHKRIESMESSLLKVKEERNTKIEDSDELKTKIKDLQAHKHQILQEKSVMTSEKQQQIEIIRKEFDIERKNWEKERKILTKNFERETFLENENVEYTNALARAQSNLQQKELENSRLKGELKWIKLDKDELDKSNNILKEENESWQGQMESAQQIMSGKNKEIIELKNEGNDRLREGMNKYNELKRENDALKDVNIKENMNVDDRNKRDNELEKRMKDLTSSLLEKQTELDMVISEKNEYKMKLEETMNGNDVSSVKKDMESGLIRRVAINRNKSTGITVRNRRNYTSYKSINKSINYGLNVFDRIGLEFAHVLRNRPWMRLLIMFYIIVLHLWCFIVLHFSINFSEDDEHH